MLSIGKLCLKCNDIWMTICSCFNRLISHSINPSNTFHLKAK